MPRRVGTKLANAPKSGPTKNADKTNAKAVSKGKDPVKMTHTISSTEAGAISDRRRLSAMRHTPSASTPK